MKGTLTNLQNIFVYHQIDRTRTDIVMLLGLQEFNFQKPPVNYLDDNLEHETQRYLIMITYKEDQLQWLEMRMIIILITEVFLSQSTFTDSIPDKHFKILRRGYPSQIVYFIKKMLNGVALSCKHYKQHETNTIKLETTLLPNCRILN